MKTTVSEAEHPLLCEGTRRVKGDLALALMITYKDDQSKLKKVKAVFWFHCAASKRGHNHMWPLIISCTEEVWHNQDSTKSWLHGHAEQLRENIFRVGSEQDLISVLADSVSNEEVQVQMFTPGSTLWSDLHLTHWAVSCHKHNFSRSADPFPLKISRMDHL